jgi:hypothetical protein
MNLLISSCLRRCLITPSALFVAIFVLSPVMGRAADTLALLDDFSNAQRSQNGIERHLIDDKTLGGQSHATQKCEGGILMVEGELLPGRGAPAFITLALPVSTDAKPHDLSEYAGVRLRVKVNKGSLFIQVGSAEIQNFDYHSSGAIARSTGDFQEVRVPFKDMKRAWSEQTALNLKSITSINFVAAGMAKDAFAYEVDEVGFY